jgi:hypothetical protein
MITTSRKSRSRTRGAVGRRVIAFAAALCAALALASPASAAQDYPISVDNCNADFQDCDTHIVHVAVPMAAMGIYVRFVSSPDMCSDIIARIGTDVPQPRILGEDRVPPGKAGKMYPITTKDANGAKVVDISVHAIGITGGCNTGGLLMWSGKLVVEHFGYVLPPPPGEKQTP